MPFSLFFNFSSILKEYSGTLSRTWKVFQLPINAQIGSQLDIFVENQGRVGYGPLVGELKVILFII